MASRKTTRSRAKRAARSKPRKTARRPASRKARVPDRRKRSDPETLRLRGVTPGFTVANLERSIRFYTDTLRFFVQERWKDDAGVVRGVMLKAGLCELGLSQDDWKKGRDRRKGEGVRIWCQTIQDVDALAARVKAAGHRLAEEPADQPWGGRAFSLDDPDGYHLTIFRG